MSDDHESSVVYWYAWTTITYRCMTADGSQKDLSELLVWPCTYFNWSPDQLVIVPDYEGYGSTASYPHPYCNFESVCNAWGVGSIEALTYQSNTTLHVGTGRAFYLRYSGGLVDEILDNKWLPREETIGGGLWAEQK